MVNYQFCKGDDVAHTGADAAAQVADNMSADKE